MTSLVVGYNSASGAGLWDGSQGASDAVARIGQLLEEAVTYRTAENTGSFRLKDIADECSSPNWDGYGAKPVTAVTCIIAAQVLKALPGSFPTPDIVPEPDGDIAFEWENENGSVFSLSVSELGVLAFAGLYHDGAKVHGSEPWHRRTLSRAIVEYIGKASFQ